MYRIDCLGEKKILAFEHANPAAFDSPEGPARLDPAYYYPATVGIVPFPKPAMGKWELRDSYVISLRRLPSAAQGYCYSWRVMYVDKENYFGAGTRSGGRKPVPRRGFVRSSGSNRSRGLHLARFQSYLAP